MYGKNRFTLLTKYLPVFLLFTAVDNDPAYGELQGPRQDVLILKAGIAIKLFIFNLLKWIFSQ